VLATASDDGTLRFWDVKTGRQLRSFAHRPADTGDISPDGRLAATSSQDNTVRVWDVETAEEKLRLPGHGDVGGYRAMRFSPGGDRLASWGDDMGPSKPGSSRADWRRQSHLIWPATYSPSPPRRSASRSASMQQ
jgi:WD40 repeat protein